MGRQATADRGAETARVGTSDDLERYRLLSEVRAAWDSSPVETDAAGRMGLGDARRPLPLTELEKRLFSAIRKAGPHGLTGTEQTRMLSTRHVGADRIARARTKLERHGLIATHRIVGRRTPGRARVVSFAIIESDPGEGDHRETLSHLAAYGRRADWIVYRMLPQMAPAEKWFESLWALYDSMTSWAERTGQLVAEAKAKGATWDEIGEALGVDAEIAYRRLYWLSEGSARGCDVTGRQRGEA